MALTFARASSHYLTVPYNARLIVTNFTIAAWVNPGTVTMQRVLSRVAASSTTSEVYGLDVYQNNCRLLIGKVQNTGLLGAAQYSVDSAVGGSVPAGVWTHVAGTYDGSTMKAFVNGVLVASVARAIGSLPLLTGTAALSIGADYNGTSAAEFFDGSMEQVRLYSRALTDNEILTQALTRGADSGCYSLLLNLCMFDGARGSTLAGSGITRDIGPFGTNATNAATAAMTYTESVSRIRRSV